MGVTKPKLIAALISDGNPVDPALLADPDVDLASLAE
jgi:hypothetical protein